jgi:hypothetical protein
MAGVISGLILLTASALVNQLNITPPSSTLTASKTLVDVGKTVLLTLEKDLTSGIITQLVGAKLLFFINTKSLWLCTRYVMMGQIQSIITILYQQSIQFLILSFSRRVFSQYVNRGRSKS